MVNEISSSAKLTQLIAAIDTASSPLDADVVRANLAIYFARLGKYETAESILVELRSRNCQSPNASLSAWVHLADGIKVYFGNFGTSRSDGVQRAHAIASAAGLHELQALSSAWLAQWSYSKLDMAALALHLREAFSLASPKSHAVLARANLVGAQALHYGGRPDLAKLWYKRATYHASMDGDDLSISAVMHNNSWLQMLNFRQVVLTNEGNPNVGRHVAMSADSNENFDNGRSDSSWFNLKGILRAQILSLNGRFADALELYANTIGVDGSAERVEANIFADRGRCCAELGDIRRTEEFVEVALRALNEHTNIDDRAAAHTSCSIAFRLINRNEEACAQEDLANRSWSIHKTNQESAIALMCGIADLAEAAK